MAKVVQIDFKNTVILLTSNVGSDTMIKLCADPETAPEPAGWGRRSAPSCSRRSPRPCWGG